MSKKIKCSMTPKIGRFVVANLKKRSEKGIKLAKQILETEEIKYPPLREAIKYYIEHWRDFTHPGLFSIACEAVGGKTDDTLLPQAAITMMAAAFDIHDDIIDGSKVKHKIPTVYGKFGAKIALLLGNAFLIDGFKILVDSTALLSEEKRKETLETVKRLTFEVGNAHALEVGLKERKEPVPESYMKVIEMKAAGIELDMHLGALFGGGKDKEIELLSRLGRVLGILGTLREEFVDIFEIEELRHRVTTQDLPVPLLFAMQDHETKKKVTKIILKSKIKESDVTKLVNVTLKSKPVVRLKENMQRLISEGTKLATYFQQVESDLQLLLSFMLEDL
ncbi:MAG: polyprenyl synthetase family protein [Candidatus Bathyarchaeia archaeon]